MAEKTKTVDRRASDNTYLHKDFHGAFCYSIKYLDENFGPEETDNYLRRVARSYFRPLSENLKKEGLAALEKHFRHIFTLEEGGFEIRYEGPTLVLDVKKCPAVEHLKNTGRLHTVRICRSTEILNDTICSDAGYESTCEYVPGAGRCVQKFRKKE